MIRVQQGIFDVGAEMAEICEGDFAVGGIASFVGVVRDTGSGPDGFMTLEHYPGMTERKLADIEQQARARWDLANVLIVHRYGKLAVGEQIVLVITASAHRNASLEACHFLIDWLKTDAPFWKYEEDGQTGGWVGARESDDAAKLKWRD